MSEDMRSDTELLVRILDFEDTLWVSADGIVLRVTRQLLAQWTGRAVQTISDYVSGKTNIPVDFWRQVFFRTRDARILNLILGDVPGEVMFYSDDKPPETGPAFFRAAVADAAAYHEAQKYIADMLADNRLCELDAEAFQRYERAHLRHRVANAGLHRAIKAAMRSPRKAGAK